jgi:hypothetical protein
MSTELDQLVADIQARFNALGTPLSEDRIKELVNSQIESLTASPEFVRKMRFAQSAPKLNGSKFARWGLSVADIEFLYDVMQANQKHGNGPSDDLRNAFKDLSEAYYLTDDQARAIDRQAIDNLFPRLNKRNFAQYEAAMRAMVTAEAGYGAQLIGAQYVGELWEGARAESRIFNLLDSFEMTAPTAYAPIEADLPEMLYAAENTSATASDYTTDKSGSRNVTVSAAKFIVHQVWSGELEEDSIIPFIPFLRRQSMLSLAHYSDSVVLNGDTTNAGTGNINLDDADPADTKHYLAMDGIRHAALVDNTGNATSMGGVAIDYNSILDLRKKMLDSTYLFDWGHPTRAEDLVFIADPSTCDEISQLDEVKTVDQIGPRATVLTGQQALIANHPLISSMAMSLTEADGKVSTTAGNNTLGQLAAVNLRGMKVGWRRRVKVETERLPGRDQTRLVYSLRMGLGRFSPTGAAAGIEWAAVLYNILVA